ncbi:MAG: glycosyltransferase family 2 protein, partial [Flavobacteriaceae bacterium]|nr:glycosyltransferase family 2 protein [Flavobacteriaceae bacterium]
MVVLIHHQNKVVAVKNGEESLPISAHKNIAKQLLKLAKEFPQEWIYWCEETQKSNLNTADFPKIFHHQKMIQSFGSTSFLGDFIGYVEDSPFVKIKRKAHYPTWQLSALVGGLHAELLNSVAKTMPLDQDFDYFLNSLGKLVMPLGVFCYSNPSLLVKNPNDTPKRASYYEIFRFVKQHYKMRWVFLLLLNSIYFRKKFPILPFIFGLFYKRRSLSPELLDSIPLVSSNKIEIPFDVDVVIPTIGRSNYLKDVIDDLAKQSLLPKKVIIVEQNPDKGSKSDLIDFLNKQWPFQIQHIFIHQTGACNARNVALKEVTADWVFLADDDIRMGRTFLKLVSKQLDAIQAEAVTVSCLQEHEDETNSHPIQWKSFGSGCSIVSTKTLKDICFDMGFEHGFGEDADFGMQLRNRGVDIVYLPNPRL